MAVLSEIECSRTNKALIAGIAGVASGLLITKVSLTAGVIFIVLGALTLIARRAYMIHRISATRYACERIAEAIGPELMRLVHPPIHLGQVVPLSGLATTVCDPNYLYASRFIPTVNRILNEEKIPLQFPEAAPAVYDEESDVEDELREPPVYYEKASDLESSDSDSDEIYSDTEPLTDAELANLHPRDIASIHFRTPPPKNPAIESAYFVRDLFS